MDLLWGRLERKYYRKSLALQSFAEKQRVTLPLRTVQKDDHRKDLRKRCLSVQQGQKTDQKGLKIMAFKPISLLSIFSEEAFHNIYANFFPWGEESYHSEFSWLCHFCCNLFCIFYVCFPTNELTKNSINIEVALSFLWQLFYCWTLLENGKYTSNLRIILMSYFAPTFPFAKFGNFQHWKSCQLFVNDLTGKVTSAPTLTTSSPYLMTLEVAPSHLGWVPYINPSVLLLTFSFLVQLNVHQLHLRILLPISPSYSVAARRIDCAGLSNSTI